MHDCEDSTNCPICKWSDATAQAQTEGTFAGVCIVCSGDLVINYKGEKEHVNKFANHTPRWIEAAAPAPADLTCQHECGDPNIVHSTCKCVKCGKEKPRLVLWKDADKVGAAPAETAANRDGHWCAHCKTIVYAPHVCGDTVGEMTPDAELDAMVRDFCAVGPKPKSEVRRRILAYAKLRVEQAERRIVEVIEDRRLVLNKFADLERERDARLKQYQAIADSEFDLRRKLKEMREALYQLRCEVSAWLGLEREELIRLRSFTNVRVMENRLENADKALLADQ